MIKNIIIIAVIVVFGPYVLGACLSIGQGFGIVPLSANSLVSKLADYSIPLIGIDYYHSYNIRQGYISLAGSL